MGIFQSLKNKFKGSKTAADSETNIDQFNPLYSGENQALHENPLYEEAPEVEPALEKQDRLSMMADRLKQSKKGGLRSALSMSGGENSEVFQSVVGTIDRINQALDQKLTGNVKTDAELLFNLSKLYATLIQNCEAYTNRRLVVTAAGKERQRIVQDAQYFAEKDKKALDEVAASAIDVPADERKNLSIREIVSEGRMLKFQVNNINANVGGANASVVYQLQNQGKDYFFKREENVLGFTNNGADYMNPVYQQVLDSIPDDPGHQKLRQHLMEFVPKVSLSMRPTQATDELYREFIINNCRVEKMDCPPEDELAEMVPYVKKIYKTAGAHYTTAEALSDIGVNPTQDQSEFNVSKRNVASSRMAELLGVGHLIAHSETAEVTDQTTGQKSRGNLMEKAEGIELADATKRAKGHTGAEVTSGSLQRSMICLQMLDNICSQVDRHFGNMMYQFDTAGKITGVQGIDNDLAFGESDSISSCFRRENARPSFKGKDQAQMSIPYMDKTMAQNIIELAGNSEPVRFALSDVLRPVEIDALCSRLQKVANALHTAMQADETKTFAQGNRFLDAGDWDAHKDEIHQTLVGKQQKGEFEEKTYYGQFMHDLG